MLLITFGLADIKYLSLFPEPTTLADGEEGAKRHAG